MARKPTPLDDHEARASEDEVALRVTALFVNRFRVRVGLELTRIAFAETENAESEAHYRVALIMPTNDALNLASTLRALADKLQAQVQAVTSAGTHGEKPN